MQDDLNASHRRSLLADQLVSYARLASFSGMCAALPMSLLLLIRRMVGGMTMPLSWPVALLLACALPLVLFLGHVPWHLGRPAARWRLALIAAGWVLAEFLLVMAVSRRGTSGGSLALIWSGWGIACGATLATWMAAGLRPQERVPNAAPSSAELERTVSIVEPTATDVSVSPQDGNSMSVELPIAPGAADQELDSCCSEDLAEDLTQRWVRGITATGDAFVAGQFRVRLPAGQRLVHFHLPIWPALREPLTVEAEVVDGEDVEVAVGQCLPQGVRWDLRCAEPFADDVELVVAVYVTEAAAELTPGGHAHAAAKESPAREFL